MFRKNCNNVETKRYICFFNVNKNYVLCMRTPNQDLNTQGPQRVSNNNQKITHQIPTKCRWNELQDAYFTASMDNIAQPPDKNFLARPGIVVILKDKLTEIREGKLRRSSNVELFMRQTKLGALKSWKVRHLAQLSSSEWVVIVQRVLSVCFRRMELTSEERLREKRRSSHATN